MAHSPKVADLLRRMDAMQAELAHLECECDEANINEIENIQAARDHLSNARDVLNYVEL